MKAKIPDIMNKFGVPYNNRFIVSTCPIHRGNNPSAFNINTDVNSEFCGRWFCNTKGCHKIYGGDILGFFRGMLEKDGPISFTDAASLAAKVCGSEKVSFYSEAIDNFFLKKGHTVGITREEVRSRLYIPPDYYLNRGFSREVLDEFDVGLCLKQDAEMNNRVVFPVYENTGKRMIGCIGRTVINDKKKWKIQKGFDASNYLFNYWRAIEWICRKGKAILVEGQGEVMRLWEAGFYNTVGIFGSNLSISQEILLQKTGVTDIITAFDNDQAGEKARRSTEQKLSRLFNVKHKVPSLKDFGEMSIEEVRSIL